MLGYVTIAIAVVIAVAMLRRKKAAFKALDVSAREAVPFDAFFAENFEKSGVPFEKEVIRETLAWVAKVSSVPQDKLRLEDGLGEIAAVAGFNRPNFIAMSMTQFEVAAPAIGRMMLAGKMGQLGNLLVTVALATRDARAPPGPAA